MKKPVSSRDLELLSAYLDQQIKAGERQKVEARLREDKEFRSSYEQLRQTRQLIRSLPAVRAPRNFTLAPAQVRPASFQRLIPAFGAASALASFLLVLVFLSSIFFFRAPTAASPAALQKESQPQVAVQSNQADQSTVQDYAMQTETEATVAAEAPALAGAASPTETPAAPRAVAPLATAQPTVTEAGEGLLLKSVPVTTTETATPSTVTSGSPPAQSGPGESFLMATPPTTAPTPAAVPEASRIAAQPVVSWIPWIEGVLFLVALGAGIAFLYLRRKTLR